MRCFFRVEYDGQAYAGWQVQDNADTVQSVLARAFSTVVRRPCRITGAGRTDAGVHARGQGAHIDIDDAVDLGGCEIAVNAVLPHDIAIYRLRKAPDSFHARFSAIERSYKYYIVERKSPLYRNRVWRVKHVLDWDCIAENCAQIAGEHDFTAFCASGHSAKSMVCKVTHASLEREGLLRVISIKADRFLYRMVRSLVGTLVDIGRGKLAGPMDAIIASRARRRVGETAPAQGLTLEHVAYKEVE